MHSLIRLLIAMIYITTHLEQTGGQIWTRMPRLCDQIAARDDQVWCVTDDKNLWRWVWGLHDWSWVDAEKYQNKMQNVGVGFDNSVWVVTVDGEVRRMVGQNWTVMGTIATFNGSKLVQISPLDQYEAMAVDSNDTIWHYGNDSWREFAGYAQWVTVGKDASVWCVRRNQEVLRWNDTDWEVMPKVDMEMTRIDAYDNSRIVATDAWKRLYLYINAGERWLGVGTPEWPPGPKWKLLQQPYPNCKQAVASKLNIWCLSDNGFVNKA
ncbi:tectonin-1-like [Paramacrobiotus metropolitanus]|uniref:tectonin-1-like n=1 Tax=Paramacrobiotus metropolitanus TaxID=2943436 RepID=UPI0024463592|nr:tectonin-1-like [Paramacrobiotus metropolitanus]